MDEQAKDISLTSMTGFGHGVAVLGQRTLRVEIRTLNHRGLDLKIRSQDCQLSAEIEAEISRRTRQKISRGSVQIIVRDEERIRKLGGLDFERLTTLHTDLLQLQESLGLKGEITLQTLALFHSSIPSGSPSEVTPDDWQQLKSAVDHALAGVVSMRGNEGVILAKDIQTRLSNLRSLAGRMRETSSCVPERSSRRLQERLAALGTDLPPVDPGRLAQEVAILVERYDVSEELVRLHAHFGQLEALFTNKSGDPPGRRIDFLAQEIGREINTLGAKIQDSQTLALVVEAKAELEKLREQAQNIE